MKFKCLVLLIAAGATVAYAQPLYQLEPGRDWLLVGSGCALTVGGLIAYHNVRPLTLDETNALDRSNVNSFDRGAIQRYGSGTTSDVATGLAVALPLTLLAGEEYRREWKVVGVMWGETLLLQSGVNAIVKSLTKRTRPYAYDRGTPPGRKTERDARVSFYSGHTSTAAAMSFFAAQLLSGHVADRRARVVIWGAAATYPAVVGILRVEAGRHFPSDVIVGYAVGATIGYVVPLMHRVGPPRRVGVESTVVGESPAVRLTWRF